MLADCSYTDWRPCRCGEDAWCRAQLVLAHSPGYCSFLAALWVRLSGGTTHFLDFMLPTPGLRFPLRINRSHSHVSVKLPSSFLAID